jgi:crossover junction endodeoxyribonuclease RuvC
MAQIVIAAIDPGIAGAIAIIGSNTILHLDDLPTHKAQHGQRAKIRHELDLHAIAALLHQHEPAHCYVEAVHAMPKQGLTSTWRFAESYGQLQGIVAALGLPLSLIPPKTWQRHHRVGPERDALRQRAVQMFPSAAARLARKRDHNRACALLLASYGVSALYRQAA